MKFTPGVKLISIVIVLAIALPSGISFASIFSSQYIPETVSYEEPAVRLSNYSINDHPEEFISIYNYNTSADANIGYEWSGPEQNNTFSSVNYSKAIFLQSISNSNIGANLTFRTLLDNYNYLANFSVYFVQNGTYFPEVFLHSNNGTVNSESPSLNTVLNMSNPLSLGIMFQPVVNNNTTTPRNVFQAEIILNLNLFHVSGNSIDIFTQYTVSIDLTLTT
ncbi:hypothetical protein OXIME_000711 [Oxyplasma meridianum]|uniref:Uncharacterized protein n=1 Tax=Oxyplasma meridianum TaxID=3073602 RepID=A0AAX4NG43_9ARCH